MKWITNGINFNRGDHRVLAAKYSGTQVDNLWFTVRASCTQQTAKSYFKMIGKYLGAESCVVTYMYDDSGFLSKGITDENTVAVTLITDDLWIYKWDEKLDRYVKIAMWEDVGN